MSGNTPDQGQQAEADLASGFEEAQPKGPVAAEPKSAPKPADPTPKPQAATPEYVQITKDKFAALEAAADKTVSLEAQLSKAFGSIGNLKQVVDRLAQSGHVGGDIEIGPEVFEELEKDFPELSASTRKGLQRLLKNLKPGSNAEPDTEAFNKKVDALVAKREMEALVDLHPDWAKIVGQSDKPDRNNKFRQWLGKQPADYQARINSTMSATIIGRAIDRFNADQAKASTAAPAADPKPPAKVVERRNRIAGAVQPRGDGGPTKPGKTANDELEAGFNEG